MKWPNPTDYQDAVQNPRFCFEDPELKAGQVALLPMGLPRVASGNFASVYEIQNGRKRWAVRCFLRQAVDQQRHYEHVSRHLKELWLPFLVDFAYQPQGIRLLGQTYPLVKMQWVDGVALHSYVKKHLARPQNLLKLAAQWRGLVNSLQGSRLAHGDLQHGNVLVTVKGAIRLVDYDALYVPSLHGTNCAELGHINYQHPQRQGTNYDHNLDNFSALVIYTALRALAVSPGLWDAFHTGENLLFSGGDFKNPAHSDVFGRLRHVSAPEVPALAHALETWCCGPFAQIGHFENVVSTALHKAASYHAAQQTTALQTVALPVNAVPNNSPAVTPPPAASPAPTPTVSPDRWWVSASPSQTQPTSAPTQPTPTPPKPSTTPFSTPTGSAPKPPVALAQSGTSGQTIFNPVDGAEIVWIPTGGFTMGSTYAGSDEYPQRQVWLSGFYMYRQPVTVAQYAMFCSAMGKSMPPTPAWGWQNTHPIVNVSWNDAKRYSQWAGVDLPTEAQWEKGARGTDGRVFPWGNDWTIDRCRFSRVSPGDAGSTTPLNTYPKGASPYGLLDMAGNVWEWCNDYYSSTSYRYSSPRDPLGPAASGSPDKARVLRGGSWFDVANKFWITTRFHAPPERASSHLGFRCVAT